MRKKSVESIVEDLMDLRSEALTAGEHDLLFRELNQLNDLYLNAQRIKKAARIDYDTAWDLAKAESLIIRNGFGIDLARIITGITNEDEKEKLIKGIQKEYEEGEKGNVE